MERKVDNSLSILMKINRIHNVLKSLNHWLPAWTILSAAIDAAAKRQAWKIEQPCIFLFFFYKATRFHTFWDAS